MKTIIERNEGKHARCSDSVTVKMPKSKAELKVMRRKIRFLTVETIRVLVTTLFLFAVAAWDGIFFPFVIMLAVTILLSVLEYEADDLE